MIVFTYSGQGSQQPGMGAAWREHPSWELVEEASEEAGRDLAYLLLEADADELRQTRNAQLATFLTSMVILDAVERLGVDAAGHAGHSLGEYSALTAAGALDFGGAVGLVVERGEAMQTAAGERTGTMAAVLGLDDEGVETACDGTDGDAWVANYNAPGQVVIAGDPDAVAAAGEAAKEAGAKRVTPLEVSGAFHTPFMAPAGDRLREALDGADIRRPEGTVVANVDALEHEDPEAWRSLLNAQLVRPVRWHQSLQRLSDLGFTTFVELGPGSVLTGLVKRTLRDAERLTVNVPDDLDRLLEALATAPEAAPPEPHEGEHLFAAAGDLLGTIGNEEVRSPFAGALMGWLALDTERVTSSQPIAWLQVH